MPGVSGVVQDLAAEQEVHCPQLVKSGPFCMFSLFKHKKLLMYLPKPY